LNVVFEVLPVDDGGLDRGVQVLQTCKTEKIFVMRRGSPNPKSVSNCSTSKVGFRYQSLDKLPREGRSMSTSTFKSLSKLGHQYIKSRAIWSTLPLTAFYDTTHTVMKLRLQTPTY
jgi:hypothetical protein